MSEFNELRDLMEEPPHGHNHGRSAAGMAAPDEEWAASDQQECNVLDTDRSRILGEWRESQRSEANPGFHVVDTSIGWDRVGMKAHRGVVHPDEYIDHEAVMAAVEEEMGFTIEEIRSVYARGAMGGPVPMELRELRDAIDARVLALSRSGANIDLLRRLLGLNSTVLKRAIARARGRE